MSRYPVKVARFFLVPYLHFGYGTRFQFYSVNGVKVTKSRIIIIRTEAERQNTSGYSRDDIQKDYHEKKAN